MATRTLTRSALHTRLTTTTAPTAALRRLSLRHAALPLGLGLTTGLVAVHQQRPMRFDSAAVLTPQARAYSSKGDRDRKELLDGETVKQLSGGSLSGMDPPVLEGVCVMSGWMCANASGVWGSRVRCGDVGERVLQDAGAAGGDRDGAYPDIVSYLKLKERASTSRIVALLNQHTAFKFSFAIAFALSAFMSF
ncbi:predicted protein [Chaetomium globosum CBS 148.51]|uniref:Uncharacterized protein n=1 Tax=Chaetomium globosum (strain ATCC 6205 / CBS 148.51 / DSM 1962 / NBRC 6347 / NRRL 1970) TaxID=306901 RepID=Q2H8T1_CHAGB|nr:uncharacterized protein CHGG_03373 [Chaetomium globosum CBS 148.51]EAQ91438.1 predicted protein [Chaetomium globosum CBS 148.51]